MNKFVILILLSILFLHSCGTLRDGFTNPKKENSDEFLVEKKSPLVMPPNYDELPMPGTNEVIEKKDKDTLDNLFSDQDNTPVEDENDDKKLEEFILDKIK
tara:strand:- start:22 stop:324 length:303 start_codon:yes stop_codon:yes gene_type:complete